MARVTFKFDGLSTDELRKVLVGANAVKVFRGDKPGSDGDVRVKCEGPNCFGAVTPAYGPREVREFVKKANEVLSG